MATITGLTKDRMLEIEASSVVDGEVVGGNLILSAHDGTTINAGSVVGPAGPAGPAGPSGISAIPGEVRMWSGSVLPSLATYGKWVWADGAVYSIATYPIAAGHIDDVWDTFAGASSPGAGNFRVPDYRGLTPVGMDAMPGGARANRTTRAVAITLAGRTGEETHVILVSELAVHGHAVAQQPAFQTPNHSHPIGDGGELLPRNPDHALGPTFTGSGFNDASPQFYSGGSGAINNTRTADVAIGNIGGNAAHENMQPTVFVPYIVKLDG